MPKIILVLVFLITATESSAQLKGGERLIEFWRSWKKSEQQSANTLTEKEFAEAVSYQEYIIGAYDGVDWSYRNIDFCPTGDTITAGQIFQIVSNYIEDNPGEWSKPAIAIVWTALRQAWPCNN